jgi:hypothetical protein
MKTVQMLRTAYFPMQMSDCHACLKNECCLNDMYECSFIFQSNKHMRD